MKKTKYSDSELIINIKMKARELGRTPYLSEVTGGHSAAKRFGTWNNELIISGLKVNRDTSILPNGTRIGMLLIEGNKRIGKHLYYECKCDCGNLTEVRSDSLLKENFTQSCGCLGENTQLKSEDITGRRYNKLLVISFTGEGAGKDEVWKCKCDCGNITNFYKWQLYDSNVKSCGCLLELSRIENAKKAHQKLKETDLIEGTSISKISRHKPIKSNTSGVTGVVWDKSKRKWVAQIEFKGKRYFLGRYEHKEDAIKIRKKAEDKLFVNFLEWYKANSSKK